jgi:aryl-alcohol dehydrogenase-like predicted oxidoreductase
VERADELKKLLPEGMTMSEMALRFILGEPTVSTIIPGMRKTSHATMNLKTSDAGPLKPELIKELEKHRWDREPTGWSQ